MAKEKKTAERLILDSFEGFSAAGIGVTMTAEERVGWCAALTASYNHGIGHSADEYLTAARRIVSRL